MTNITQTGDGRTLKGSSRWHRLVNRHLSLGIYGEGSRRNQTYSCIDYRCRRCAGITLVPSRTQLGDLSPVPPQNSTLINQKKIPSGRTGERTGNNTVIG